eukprot:533996-Hanusia_phi.AAC.3
MKDIHEVRLVVLSLVLWADGVDTKRNRLLMKRNHKDNRGAETRTFISKTEVGSMTFCADL